MGPQLCSAVSSDRTVLPGLWQTPLETPPAFPGLNGPGRRGGELRSRLHLLSSSVIISRILSGHSSDLRIKPIHRS